MLREISTLTETLRPKIRRKLSTVKMTATCPSDLSAVFRHPVSSKTEPPRKKEIKVWRALVVICWKMLKHFNKA